jgi:hypothetical protein
MERELRPTDRLAPKSAEIAAKVIDGEAIIINLTNGFYYSMDGAGAVVWEAIQAHRSLEAIARALSRRYSVSRDAALSDARALVVQLIAEELVAVAESESPDAGDEGSAVAQPLAYTAPALEKFGDMAHFFAVDPPMPELDETDDKSKA